MKAVKQFAYGFILLAMCFALAGSDGCGSSSGSSGSSSPSVSGTAVVNPLLVGAAISVTDAKGASVAFSGSSVTDASGNYTIDVPPETPLPMTITFTGGHFAGSSDAFNGTLATLAESLPDPDLYATTLTTLCVELYNNLKATGLSASSAASDADSIVRGLVEPFGTFHPFDTPPIVTNSTNLSTIQSYRYANNHFVALLAENVGADIYGSAQGKNSENLYKLVKAVAQDLTDGKWDGNTAAGVTAGTELGLMVGAYGSGASFSSAINSKTPNVTWSSTATVLNNEMQYTGGSVYGITPSPNKPGQVIASYQTDTTQSAANAPDSANDFASSGGGSSSPVQLGEAWIQTTHVANSSVNAAPYFVDTASVTSNMKIAGALGNTTQRLHSWAGWFLWGNGNIKYKVTDASGNQINTGNLAQGAIVAEPMSAKFIAPNLDYPSLGVYSGLMLGVPVAQLITWSDSPYNKYPGSNSLALSPMSQALPLLHLFPTNSTYNLADPSWTPQQALGNRMGDWDIEAKLTNPSSNNTETLTMTMAQGSPFAWFNYAAPGAGVTMAMHTGTPYPAATRTVVVENATSDVSSLATNLGCVIVGAQDQQIPGGVALTGNAAYSSIFRYLAVFYDTSSTKAVLVNQTANDGSTVQGVYLEPQTANSTFHFVVAGLPTVQYSGASSDTYAPNASQVMTEAKAWTKALAPYAFNQVTDTDVTWNVQHTKGLVTTTFTPTVTAKGPIGASASGKTVMCLKRHHYADFNDGQNGIVFNGGSTALATANITPTAAGPFTSGNNPTANNGHYPYWTVTGKLVPIAASSFSVNYVYNNILPFMPPPEDNATNGSQNIWQVFNRMNGWQWQKYISSAPPANTQINGGPQVGGYTNMALLRMLSGSLAVAKKLAEVPVTSKGEDNSSAVAGLPLNANWGLGTNPSPVPTFNSTTAFNFYLENVEDFISLSTSKTAFQGWSYGGGGDTSVPSDSASYFRYVPNIGAVLYYPENIALAAGGGLAQIPLPMKAPTNPESGFQGTTGWADWHYSYGYLLTAMAQTAMMAPHANSTSLQTFFNKERYGQFGDQIAMTIAYDPNVSAFWNTSSAAGGLNYSKMNFFDQWNGQGWTDGVWSNADNGTLNDYVGKQENSFGEAWNFWSGMALWGMATGRQQVADLGIYLATTCLYNYQAYWADQQQSRIAASPKETADGNRWSASGDYVPAASYSGQWGSNGATYQSTWFFWGTADGTSSPGPAAAWAMKLQQAQVIIQSEFGDAMPISAVYNHWFPITSATLGFAREPVQQTASDEPYQQHIPATLNKLSDKGWDTGLNNQLTNYIGTVNKMQALTGMDSTYDNPRDSTLQGLSPLDWFWGAMGNQTSAAWSNMNNANFGTGVVDDSKGTVSEDLNMFWTLGEYGSPNWKMFSYSPTVAANSGMVQPATAVFDKVKGTNAYVTFVAFNPNNATITVNWWVVGKDATGSAGVLSTPMTVPPNWFNSTTVVDPLTPS